MSKDALYYFFFPFTVLLKCAHEPHLNKYGYLLYSGVIFHSGLQAAIVLPSCSRYKKEQYVQAHSNLLAICCASIFLKKRKITVPVVQLVQPPPHIRTTHIYMWVNLLNSFFHIFQPVSSLSTGTTLGLGR